MKTNLTYNNKPVIEPKCLLASSSDNSSLCFSLITNEENINIIKDMKNNFYSVGNSRTFFFIETHDKCYFYNCTKLSNTLLKNFSFCIVLINDDNSLNQDYIDLYLSFGNKEE